MIGLKQDQTRSCSGRLGCADQGDVQRPKCCHRGWDLIGWLMADGNQLALRFGLARGCVDDRTAALESHLGHPHTPPYDGVQACARLPTSLLT